MTTYRIEAVSVAELIERIDVADSTFVVRGENGVRRVRQSCVSNPAQVMVDGAPVNDGEGGVYTPKVPADPEVWFSVIETSDNAALEAIGISNS